MRHQEPIPELTATAEIYTSSFDGKTILHWHEYNRCGINELKKVHVFLCEETQKIARIHNYEQWHGDDLLIEFLKISF